MRHRNDVLKHQARNLSCVVAGILLHMEKALDNETYYQDLLLLEERIQREIKAIRKKD